MAEPIMEAAGIEPAQDSPGVESRKVAELAISVYENGRHVDTLRLAPGDRVSVIDSRPKTFAIVELRDERRLDLYIATDGAPDARLSRLFGLLQRALRGAT